MSPPVEVREFLDGDQSMLMGSEWVASSTGNRFESNNPATAALLATLPESSSDDVDGAVSAGDLRLSRGRQPPPSVHSSCLADLFEAHAHELAQLDVLDNGKTLNDALAMDPTLTIEIFPYWSDWVTTIGGRQIPVSLTDFHTYTRREPLGVVAAIIPWNFRC